jgi:Ca-activated chloride channel family protein
MVIRRPIMQLLLVTVLAGATLAWQTWRHGDFVGLWFTPDQRAQSAYDDVRFQRAAELFEDPAWKGVAEYRSGLYEASAASFGRIPTATGFFNRGNALMKNREYAKAITAYEQAVAEAPGWQEAEDNLRLSRYVLDYIERAREQSDTGDESELGADDYVFDNTRERGREMEITEESTIELESAEKWMRAVDTQTRDFLRTRFMLEAYRREGQ